MRHRSPIWTKLAVRGKFRMEAVALINGVAYTKITAPKIERSLLSDPLSVGNCISATLQVSILTDDEIDTTAPVIIKARITDGKLYSEWLEFGTFYVDLPDTSFEGLITLSCYDSMLKTSQAYVDETDNEEEWPKPMKACIEEIASRIGVGIDPRTRINVGVDYLVPFPSGRTMQQVLGFIGAVHGGNWIITEENLLRLVPLITSPSETFNIIDRDYNTIMTGDGYRLAYRLTENERVETQPPAPGTPPVSLIPVTNRITDEKNNSIVSSDGHYLIWGLDGSVSAVGGLINVPIVTGSINTGKVLKVSKVTMTDENNNTYSVGDNFGYEIRIEANPYACSNICKSLYEKFNGLVYSPYTATNACYDPATELGDWVKIGDKVCSVIYTTSLSLDIDYRADISAPTSNELSRQYPFLTETDKLKSKELLNASTDYAGVTLNTENGFTAKKSAETKLTRAVPITSSVVKAEVRFNENKIAFLAVNEQGDMESCIYYDDVLNRYRISNAVYIEDVQSQNETIKLLQKALDDISSSENENVGNITVLTNKVSELSSSVSSIKAIAEGNIKDIQQIQGSVIDLTAANEQINNKITALQNTAEIQSGKIETLENSLAAVLERLSALENPTF